MLPVCAGAEQGIGRVHTGRRAETWVGHSDIIGHRQWRDRRRYCGHVGDQASRRAGRPQRNTARTLAPGPGCFLVAVVGLEEAAERSHPVLRRADRLLRGRPEPDVCRDRQSPASHRSVRPDVRPQRLHRTDRRRREHGGPPRTIGPGNNAGVWEAGAPKIGGRLVTFHLAADLLFIPLFALLLAWAMSAASRRAGQTGIKCSTLPVAYMVAALVETGFTWFAFNCGSHLPGSCNLDVGQGTGTAIHVLSNVKWLLLAANFPSLAMLVFPALHVSLPHLRTSQVVDHGPRLVDWVAEGSLDAAFVAIAGQIELPKGVSGQVVGVDRIGVLAPATCDLPSTDRRQFAGRTVATYTTELLGGGARRARRRPWGHAVPGCDGRDRGAAGWPPGSSGHAPVPAADLPRRQRPRARDAPLRRPPAVLGDSGPEGAVLEERTADGREGTGAVGGLCSRLTLCRGS